MPRLVPLIALILLLFLPARVLAASLEIPFHAINADGVGAPIGTVLAHDSDQGLVITPSLEGLQEGEHGFHLHAGESCDAAMNGDGVMVAGLAAEGHWDPDATNTHLGPFGNGHRGDLSRLVVDVDGNTTTTVVAPRLSVADLHGRTLIIHAGGDTYSDTPALGGGGARIACGMG